MRDVKRYTYSQLYGERKMPDGEYVLASNYDALLAKWYELLHRKDIKEGLAALTARAIELVESQQTRCEQERDLLLAVIKADCGFCPLVDCKGQDDIRLPRCPVRLAVDVWKAYNASKEGMG